jgi:hypothetical protein
MTPKYRTAVAAYVAAGRHLRDGGEGAKPVKQMAEEIGTDPNTVRRWLRRDHRQLWMEYWPSINELWAVVQRDKVREGEQHEMADHELVAFLDRSLQELLGGRPLQDARCPSNYRQTFPK